MNLKRKPIDLVTIANNLGPILEKWTNRKIRIETYPNGQATLSVDGISSKLCFNADEFNDGNGVMARVQKHIIDDWIDRQVFPHWFDKSAPFKATSGKYFRDQNGVCCTKETVKNSLGKDMEIDMQVGDYLCRIESPASPTTAPNIVLSFNDSLAKCCERSPNMVIEPMVYLTLSPATSAPASPPISPLEKTV